MKRIINNKERLYFAAANTEGQVLAYFHSTQKGLTKRQVEISRDTYGDNVVTHGKKDCCKRICDAFINPFTAILFVLARVSIFTDVIFAEVGEKDVITVIIIAAMVIISGALRFIAKDLFISQSALTGESEPVEKYAHVQEVIGGITEASNLALMGSNVISGSAAGIAVATGNDTMFGEIAKEISGKPSLTSFEKGVNTVS